MKVQCGQCPAKYSVSDDRIAGRKVRIRCKRCGAAIVVDGKLSPPRVTTSPAHEADASAAEPSRPAAPPPPASPPTPKPPPSRPVAHTILGGLEAPVAEKDAAKKKRSVPPPKPPRKPDSQPGMPSPDRGWTDPPQGSDADRWRVALTKNDMRFMNLDEIAEAYRAGVIKPETFVFKKGMTSWVTLPEVAEIAAVVGLDVYSPSSPPSLREPGSGGRARGGRASGSSEDAEVVFDLVAKKSADEAPERAEPEPGAFLTITTPVPRAASAEVSPAAEPNAPASASRARAPQSSEPELEVREEEASTLEEPVGAQVETMPPGAPAPPGAAAPAQVSPDVAQAPKAAGAATSERGSSPWIWVAVATILAAAAAAYLAPRFGVQLY